MTAIADQSASELRANLRARREWAASATGWRRRDALRDIREMEDELRARGELPEPEPPRPQLVSRPKGVYRTTHRVKMHTVGTPPDDDPGLCFHEDRGDGVALCGQPLKPWVDESGALRDVEWAQFGEGPVDCGKCANISGAVVGYEPLAEPQGESVRTVSGGAFEMNRDRH